MSQLPGFRPTQRRRRARNPLSSCPFGFRGSRDPLCQFAEFNAKAPCGCGPLRARLLTPHPPGGVSGRPCARRGRDRAACQSGRSPRGECARLAGQDARNRRRALRFSQSGTKHTGPARSQDRSPRHRDDAARCGRRWSQGYRSPPPRRSAVRAALSPGSVATRRSGKTDHLAWMISGANKNGAVPGEAPCFSPNSTEYPSAIRNGFQRSTRFSQQSRKIFRCQ